MASFGFSRVRMSKWVKILKLDKLFGIGVLLSIIGIFSPYDIKILKEGVTAFAEFIPIPFISDFIANRGGIEALGRAITISVMFIFFLLAAWPIALIIVIIGVCYKLGFFG